MLLTLYQEASTSTTSSPKDRFASEDILEEKTASSKRKARALCPPVVASHVTTTSSLNCTEAFYVLCGANYSFACIKH